MDFDVVVLGTGAAALTVVWQCHAAKKRVAVVDSRPFGGTCALRGCDPKKVLVGAAEACVNARQLSGKGVRSEGLHVDWNELMRFKRTFTEPVPKAREASFAQAGIAAFQGVARFVGRNAVQVGDARLEARNIVIATGARPATLGFAGEEHLATSETFLDLDRLPKRLVFVGGGYISFEFAHIAARAGAQATILHRGERALEGFEPELVSRLVEHSRAAGIDVRLRTPVAAVEKRGAAFVVRTANGAEVEGDLVVHGAGRVPQIAELDLATGGVESTVRGVVVDEFLRSVSNPAVYACGDAAASPGLPLTPIASLEGRIAATNLLEGNHARPNYAGVPSAVFTLPPLARVGLGEREAREQGLKIRVNAGDSSGWYSSRRIGEQASGFKVLIEEGTDRIVGAHLLGAHAAEVINLFALAIRHAVPAAALKDSVFSYPTSSSDLSYML